MQSWWEILVPKQVCKALTVMKRQNRVQDGEAPGALRLSSSGCPHKLLSPLYLHPPRLHSVVFTLFPPPHPTPRCFPCTRTTLTQVTLAHPRSHTCKHTHACTAHSALFDQLTPLALSHMHADTRQGRTASSSFSLPALFTRTHCKKYPFFTLLARHVCKSGLFLQCVQDLAVTLRAEGGLQCMSQWQPQKKIYIWWKLHMKNGVTMKFFCCLFFLSNIQCCAKAWSLLLSLYILFGKWEISEVFIETCKHAWNKVYEGKNRVCAVLMSLKVHIWPPVQ